MSISTHYFKGEKKKKIIKEIERLIELNKQEREIFIRNIIRQFDKIIEIAKETKKGNYPIEYLLEVSKKKHDYIELFLKKNPKIKKEVII